MANAHRRVYVSTAAHAANSLFPTLEHLLLQMVEQSAPARLHFNQLLQRCLQIGLQRTRGEKLGNTDSFGARFGALVARKRQQEGLSLAGLAARMHPIDDPTGERRAPDVLKFERGQSKRPRALTIKRYQDALHITQEEVDALVDEANRPQWLLTQQLIEQKSELAKRLELSENLAVGIAERYAEGNPNDLDAALRGLENALEIAAEEQRKNKLPTNIDNAVDAVLTRISELNQDGEIESAKKVISDEESRISAGLSRLYDAGIAQAVLTFDQGAACNYEIKKAHLATSDVDTQFGLFLDAQKHWYNKGKRRGLRFELEVSERLAATYELSLLSHRKRSVLADRQGLSQRALGILIGGRVGAEWLSKSVDSFREALEYTDRATAAANWALSAQNLSSVLTALADRTVNSEAVELRKEAIKYLEEASAAVSGNRAPEVWAMVVNNHAMALRALSERQPREVAIQTLGKAIELYRASLEETSKEDDPVAWAETSSNIGNALIYLNDKSADGLVQSRMNEAKSHFRAALEVLNKDEDPMRWALVQQNLGLATTKSAEMLPGQVAVLEAREAIRAFECALQVYTPKAQPFDWARVTLNLGLAHRVFARHSNTLDMASSYNAASDCIEECKSVFTRSHHPFEWGLAEANGAQIELERAQHKECVFPGPHIRKAEEHLDKALEVFDPGQTPFYFNALQELRRQIDYLKSKVAR